MLKTKCLTELKLNALFKCFQVPHWLDGSPLAFQLFTNNLYHYDLKTDFYQVSCFKHNAPCSGKQGFRYDLRFTQNTIFPTYFDNKTRLKYMCTMMMVENLASPHWINTACEEKLRHNVMCAIPQSVRSQQKRNFSVAESQAHIYCPEASLKQNTKCFLVTWINMTDVEGGGDLKWYPVKDTVDLLFITDRLKLSPIIFPQGLIYQFDQFLNKYTRTLHTNALILQGYTTSWSFCFKTKIDRNTFRCANNISISPLRACDGQDDCDDMSDETFCTCETSERAPSVSGNECDKTSLKIWIHMCMPKTALKSDPACSGASGPILGQTSKFNTLYGPLIPKRCDTEMVEYTSLDNTIILSMLRGKHSIFGKNPMDISCKPGHPESFNISDLCVYRLNKLNNMCPCSNGAHLADCGKFECNMMFKCSDNYCIPWGYVCDAKWDCPSGVDETPCTDFHCTNMFKCKTKNTCIHLGHVCNEIEDCLDGEDEQLCELKGLVCPQKCECLLFTLLCIMSKLDDSDRLEKLVFVKIIDSHVQRRHLITLALSIDFTLVNANVTVFCDLFQSKYLIHLHIEKNIFPRLQRYCFCGYQHLLNIKLISSRMELLASHSFANLDSLKYCNLTDNLLSTFHSNTFCNVSELKVLSLLKNQLLTIESSSLQGLNIELIETADYYVCFIASSSTQCTASLPWYLSCCNLLPIPYMRAVFIAISLMVVIANIISVVTFRVTKKNTNRSYIIVSICINIAEMFCGLYLCVIWIADIDFSRQFVLQENVWRSSFGCHAASFSLLFFAVSDSALLFVLALLRLRIVRHPMESRAEAPLFVRRSVSLSLFVSLVFSLTISVLFQQLHRSMSTSLCLIFIDPTNSKILSKVTTLIAALYQFFILAGIAVTYCRLLQELQKSTSIRKSESSTKNNKSLILQLVIITTSNVLCWIPMNVIYFVCMALSRYPYEMVMWSAVSVTPINSVVFPVVFIGTSLKSVWKKRKLEKERAVQGQ